MCVCVCVRSTFAATTQVHTQAETVVNPHAATQIAHLHWVSASVFIQTVEILLLFFRNVFEEEWSIFRKQVNVLNV